MCPCAEKHTEPVIHPAPVHEPLLLVCPFGCPVQKFKSLDHCTLLTLFILANRFLFCFSDTRHIKDKHSRDPISQLPRTAHVPHMIEVRDFDLQKEIDSLRYCITCYAVDSTNAKGRCKACNADDDCIVFICCRCGFSERAPRRRRCFEHVCRHYLRIAAVCTSNVPVFSHNIAMELLELVRPPVIPWQWILYAGHLLLPTDFVMG